ncbi:MAG: site-specific tyrosine recombinase XerC [Myxococcota bacterium]
MPLRDSDPESLGSLAEDWFSYRLARNYSEHTVYAQRHSLKHFFVWLEEAGIRRAQDVTKPVLERYQKALFHYRSKRGAPLGFHSQHVRLGAIRGFFRWLAQRNIVLFNPAAELEMPKVSRSLPREVLTPSEVESVLGGCDVESGLGIRDRAILEVFYSTGMRRQELMGLSIYDIELERSTVLIRKGKGRRERVVPLGARALAWVERYLSEVRPGLAPEPDGGTLFLTAAGEEFSPNRMSDLVSGYITQADIGKRGSCHVFRHTVATLMLENGADIRFIQAMLGHAKLDTTQIYTQVSIRKLQEIHAATHPARVKRREEGIAETDAES